MTESGHQDQATPTKPTNEFVLGWPILLASIVGVYASLATLPFYAVQNLFGPLKEAFGWSRTEVSLAVTLMGLGNLLSSYVAGAVTDRYGSRPVALVSGLLLALCLFLLTLNNGNLQQFWLTYFIMTIAEAGTLPLT